jgi:hypothetical protein
VAAAKNGAAAKATMAVVTVVAMAAARVAINAVAAAVAAVAAAVPARHALLVPYWSALTRMAHRIAFSPDTLDVDAGYVLALHPAKKPPTGGFFSCPL